MHSKCLQKFPKCATNYVAGVHRTAVSLAGEGAPVRPNSKLVVSKSLQGQVLLPAGCLMSVKQLLEAEDKVDVIQSSIQSTYGLMGKVSNRGKMYAVRRQHFGNFVRSNRSPTGRTPDKHGRYHGAVYYLAPKFTCLKPAEQVGKVAAYSYTKKEAPVSAVFNEAFRVLVQLQPVDQMPVAPTTLHGWLREYFGHSTDSTRPPRPTRRTLMRNVAYSPNAKSHSLCL